MLVVFGVFSGSEAVSFLDLSFLNAHEVLSEYSAFLCRPTGASQHGLPFPFYLPDSQVCIKYPVIPHCIGPKLSVQTVPLYLYFSCSSLRHSETTSYLILNYYRHAQIRTTTLGKSVFYPLSSGIQYYRCSTSPPAACCFRLFLDLSLHFLVNLSSFRLETSFVSATPPLTVFLCHTSQYVFA